MSQTQRTPLTADEFLAWESGQDGKWEFDRQRPMAMMGGTFAHSAITGNLITALNNGLSGHPCRPAGPDLKLRIGSSFRHPDAFVFCTKLAPDALFAPEPVVIFEVLSPSTALDGRTTTMSEYLSLPPSNAV